MASSTRVCALAMLAGCAFLALLPAALASNCEYWGVDVGCDYDGRHRRPERCKGLGRRYCDRAPEAEDCPQACEAKYCRRNGEDTHQFHKNHFEFKWEDLVLANDYDMVFTEGKEICVQTCWRAPWDSSCNRRRRYDGNNYCVDLNCEHDDENRFVGCHKDNPWHKPTCDECAHLFPNACGSELRKYVEDTSPSREYQRFRGADGKGNDDSDGDDDSSESRKRRDCGSSSDSNDDNCRVGPDDAPTENDSYDYFDEAYPVLHVRDGVEYLSFNEIIFQLSGYAADVSKPGMAAAVAEIAGVPATQAETVQVVDVPVTVRATANATDDEEDYEAPEPITTVTVVVWSANPIAIDDRMDAVLEKSEMTGQMKAAGVSNYLGASMSTNILAAPVSAIQNIFPEAATLAAKQQTSASRASSAAGTIALAVGCSLFAIGTVGVAAIFIHKRLAAKKEQERAMEDKLTSLEDSTEPVVAQAAPEVEALQ
mmetsp:Transcript_16145/g.41249  ORF Transcript_16145/g.41249 Transcript_16145/m.41249 type:complete len:483 (+) Transcript_16145:94-1542(+)